MLVVGTGLFSYNILNFSFTDRRGVFGELPSVAYYYTETSLFLISTSVILIVVGILVIRNKTLYTPLAG